LIKNFIIKESWILDTSGNKKIKLSPLKEHEIPSLVDVEKISGGCGNIKEK
jgi:hypothetical protein